MTIKECCPEINANQIAMLHRLVVECLPKKKFGIPFSTEISMVLPMDIQANNVLDQALQAIDKLFGVDDDLL